MEMDTTSSGMIDSVELPSKSNKFAASTHEVQQSEKRCSKNVSSNVNVSTTSLADSNSCRWSQHHQYHYIQYPEHLPQQTQQQVWPPKTQLTQPQQCHCVCSCSRQATPSIGHLSFARHAHSHQSSVDSQMAVAAIVHHQRNDDSEVGGGAGDSTTIVDVGGGGIPKKTKSEQSLLNHSYQALQLHEEKPLNLPPSKNQFNLSCDCDLECTCIQASNATNTTTNSNSSRTPTQKIKSNTKHNNTMADAMLGVDEITVSESDNNSTMVKKKRSRDRSKKSQKYNSWCQLESETHHRRNKNNCDSNNDFSQIDIYSDGEIKGGGPSVASDGDNRPPLPPRPPPRQRNSGINTNATHRHDGAACGIKKYVFWSLVCGGFSCLLGVLFLGVYFLLHSYTITVGNFETVPTFVPATMLILTGLCIISLARRRNRYSYLIKLSGAGGLLSALMCALVTVTTTVSHMSRLQALRECEYAQKTRTCTCYSDMIESHVDRIDKEGVRLVFDSLSDCGVVHGSLYSCLRAIFGLSVAGVLIGAFNCMLVYQLLSHERKKMYWEQLELRCRSLYTSQQGPTANVAAVAGGARSTMCRCCEQCHAHRQVQASLPPTAYPWDDGGEARFWTGQPPGNFYSPNPGGDEMTANACAASHSAANARSRATGWSWPRMPWQRSSPDSHARFRQTPSSPDSQYGFSNNVLPAAENVMTTDDVAASVHHHNVQTFNVVAGSLPYGVWGPPPPYSDPNSPARRGYYHYIQPPTTICNSNGGSDVGADCPPQSGTIPEQHMPCLNHRSAFLDQPTSGACCVMQTAGVHSAVMKRPTVTNSHGSGGKFKVDYANTTPSDNSDGGVRDRDQFSNTLPTRKLKKRIEVGAKSIGPNSHTAASRVNVQQLFSEVNVLGTELGSATTAATTAGEQEYHEPAAIGRCDEMDSEQVAGVSKCGHANRMACKQSAARHKRGIENTAFQSATGGGANMTNETSDPTESEVYFADVSSCCNVSLTNDNYYDDANPDKHMLRQTSHQQQQQHHHHHHHHHQQQQQQQQHHQHQHQTSNCSSSHNSNSNNEDYLSQRFGQRENSIRSRLPFPQIRTNEYEENLNVPTVKCSSGGSIVSSASSSNHMQKEISRQSMCSVESEPKTEFTDLSPSTPCGNNLIGPQFIAKLPSSASDSVIGHNAGNNKSLNDLSELATPRTPTTHQAPPNFVASFPYSSESQSLEAHRRSTKDIHELMITSEAHYEVINDNVAHCQFSISPKMHAHNSHERSNSSSSNSNSNSNNSANSNSNNNNNKRGEHALLHKNIIQSKSRERLDVPAAFQSEPEWLDKLDDRKRL